MIHFIYRWKDPRNPDEILSTRYVGMTNNPNARMMQHLFCDGQNQEKDAWMKELTDLNLVPVFEIIEVVYEGRVQAREREKHWIRSYLDQGSPLTNIKSTKQSIKECYVIEASVDMEVYSQQESKNDDADEKACFEWDLFMRSYPGIVKLFGENKIRTSMEMFRPDYDSFWLFWTKQFALQVNDRYGMCQKCLDNWDFASRCDILMDKDNPRRMYNFVMSEHCEVREDMDNLEFNDCEEIFFLLEWDMHYGIRPCPAKS